MTDVEQAPIYAGSRWLSNVDGKTVYVVMACKAFGRFEIKKPRIVW